MKRILSLIRFDGFWERVLVLLAYGGLCLYVGWELGKRAPLHLEPFTPNSSLQGYGPTFYRLAR